MPDTEVLLEDLGFPECPRWHDGRLWFSDHALGVVSCMEPGGRVEAVVEVPGNPSGLGWRPDGTMLVVSMADRRLHAWNGHRLTEVADLGALATWHCNDMVVDAEGRAYVGNFGFDLHGGTPAPAVLCRVDPDGGVHTAAGDLMFPNGTVIWPDGRTLVVAETYAFRLTAFEIMPGGELRDRREWSPTPGVFPDGICLDVEGGIWAASATTGEVIRYLAGGEVTHRLRTTRTQAYACMLGGDDGRTLFVCTSTGLNHDQNRSRRGGRIEVVRVDVPHAGLP